MLNNSSSNSLEDPSEVGSLEEVEEAVLLWSDSAVARARFSQNEGTRSRARTYDCTVRCIYGVRYGRVR